MAMNWIDYIVVTVVILVGLGIFYKALKEPINQVFSWIRGLIGYGRSKISGASEGGYYPEIVYR